ncbi:MAG: hypothetical protein ACRDZR_14770 [Acidimicrobiales bacterium]
MNWPDDPAAILDGSRGRCLCWNLSRVVGGQAPGWQKVWAHQRDVAPFQLAAELGAAVGAVVDDPVALSANAIFDALDQSVNAAMYWQEPDDVDRALGAPEVAAALISLAAALAISPTTAWWAAPLDGADQHAVVFDSTPTQTKAGDLAQWRAETLADEKAAAERPSDPRANCSGRWWSTPVFAGLTATTRSLPEVGPVGLRLVEDAMGWNAATTQRVEMPASARVYEITGPDAWANLVGSYPLDVSRARRHDWWRITGRVGRWLIPDYLAVAADFDAVHLSVVGYLTAAGRPVDLGHDAASVLAGWDPDETYWLTGPPGPAGPSQRWFTSAGTVPSRWTSAD